MHIQIRWHGIKGFPGKRRRVPEQYLTKFAKIIEPRFPYFFWEFCRGTAASLLHRQKYPTVKVLRETFEFSAKLKDSLLHNASGVLTIKNFIFSSEMSSRCFLLMAMKKSFSQSWTYLIIIYSFKFPHCSTWTSQFFYLASVS